MNENTCDTCGIWCGHKNSPIGNCHPPKLPPVETMPLVSNFSANIQQRDADLTKHKEILVAEKQKWAHKLQAILASNMMLYIREPELHRRLTELITELEG